MRNFRFNIATVLGVISLLGVGIAGLRESDDLWDSGVFTLTIGVLFVSILLTVHRSNASRAYWIGFALFGWGYLSLTLIPSTDSRLITRKALTHLDQANILGNHAMVRAVLDPDRMRAYNVSSEDVMRAVTDYSVNGSPRRPYHATVRTSPAIEVLTWNGRYNKPKQYGNIILKVNSDGELLRLKDVATVDLSAAFYSRGSGTGTTENFVRIGHSFLALLAAWLGGQFSRRLSRGSRP